MSIDEVMKIAAVFGPDSLRAAIEQHAAEEVSKEREECAKMADEYATWGGSNFYDWFKKLATAIRARAEKETT